MIVGLQIFIEKEEMVLDSNFWCGCPENIQTLNYANDTIPGDNPSVAYATVYPMCMFLRVIIAQVLLMFLLN